MPAQAQPLFQPFPMLPGRRAQVWRHHPAFRRPRHFHEEPELNLIVRGTARISVGAREIQVGAGQLLSFQPGQDHELLAASDDLELFVLALRPELAARLRGLPALPACGSAELTPSQLAAAAEQLGALGLLADGHAVEAALCGVFEALGARLANAHVLSRRAFVGVRVEPSVSVGELAQRLRVTRSDLSRHFHRDLGVRLVEYRARLRLMEFVRLVDAGQSLSRAALDADFGSYAQCHRVFQRTLRCAPQAYFAGARARVNDALCLAGAQLPPR